MSLKFKQLESIAGNIADEEQAQEICHKIAKLFTSEEKSSCFENVIMIVLTKLQLLHNDNKYLMRNRAIQMFLEAAMTHISQLSVSLRELLGQTLSMCHVAPHAYVQHLVNLTSGSRGKAIVTHLLHTWLEGNHQANEYLIELIMNLLNGYNLHDSNSVLSLLRCVVESELQPPSLSNWVLCWDDLWLFLSNHNSQNAKLLGISMLARGPSCNDGAVSAMDAESALQRIASFDDDVFVRATALRQMIERLLGRDLTRVRRGAWKAMLRIVRDNMTPTVPRRAQNELLGVVDLITGSHCPLDITFPQQCSCFSALAILSSSCEDAASQEACHSFLTNLQELVYGGVLPLLRQASTRGLSKVCLATIRGILMAHSIGADAERLLEAMSGATSEVVDICEQVLIARCLNKASLLELACSGVAAFRRNASLGVDAASTSQYRRLYKLSGYFSDICTLNEIMHLTSDLSLLAFKNERPSLLVQGLTDYIRQLENCYEKTWNVVTCCRLSALMALESILAHSPANDFIDIQKQLISKVCSTKQVYYDIETMELSLWLLMISRLLEHGLVSRNDIQRIENRVFPNLLIVPSIMPSAIKCAAHLPGSIRVMHRSVAYLQNVAFRPDGSSTVSDLVQYLNVLTVVLDVLSEEIISNTRLVCNDLQLRENTRSAPCEHTLDTMKQMLEEDVVRQCRGLVEDDSSLLSCFVPFVVKICSASQDVPAAIRAASFRCLGKMMALSTSTHEKHHLIVDDMVIRVCSHSHNVAVSCQALCTWIQTFSHHSESFILIQAYAAYLFKPSKYDTDNKPTLYQCPVIVDGKSRGGREQRECADEILVIFLMRCLQNLVLEYRVKDVVTHTIALFLPVIHDSPEFILKALDDVMGSIFREFPSLISQVIFGTEQLILGKIVAKKNSFGCQSEVIAALSQLLRTEGNGVAVMRAAIAVAKRHKVMIYEDSKPVPITSSLQMAITGEILRTGSVNLLPLLSMLRPATAACVKFLSDAKRAGSMDMLCTQPQAELLRFVGLA